MHERSALILRPALQREARAMAIMSRELIEAGLGWRYTPPRMGALVRDPDTVVLAACHDGRLHGFAAMHFGEEQAHLLLLCVQPALQRQRIGRRLVEWLLASARVAGIGTVHLELRVDNDAALAFYQQLGFTEVQQMPGYYSGRVDALRLMLALRPS
jgi:[ribosomal protein S18]-alanine N-acetyltransferase